VLKESLLELIGNHFYEESEVK